MLANDNQCRHCGGRMTEPKPVPAGLRAGQTRRICLKCGHTEYYGAPAGTLPPEYLARQADRAATDG